MTTEFRLAIPDDVWEPNGDLTDDPRACLFATLRINGVSHHLEAWAVTTIDGYSQHADHPEYTESFEQLHDAVSADGNFETTRIADRDYILVASPYC